MVELSRTVRFCLNADGSLAAETPVANSFAAWPAMRGLGRYYELTLTCRGRPDPQTGYFINIKQIDQAVRCCVLPRIADFAGENNPPMGTLMRQIIDDAAEPLGARPVAACLQLTPTYSLAIEEPAMDQLLLTQRYEFAAAHRLHSPALSAEENQAVYGKCNNPAGHGHNYQVDVMVRCPMDETGRVLAVERLDAVVDEVVVDKLDHKNLDCDIATFGEQTSSVENISRLVYEWLEGPVGELGVTLDGVRVWETSKTSCLYRPEAG